MATPVATSPTTLVQPPTPTWRPWAPAQMSACAAGATANGSAAIAVQVNSAAASFFMAHILLLAPACADYHARHCAVRDIGQPHSELCTFDSHSPRVPTRQSRVSL